MNRDEELNSYLDAIRRRVRAMREAGELLARDRVGWKDRVAKLAELTISSDLEPRRQAVVSLAAAEFMAGVDG